MNYKYEIISFINNKYGINATESEIREKYMGGNKVFILPCYIIRKVLKINLQVLEKDIKESFKYNKFKYIESNNGFIYFYVDIKKYYIDIYSKLCDMFETKVDSSDTVWYVNNLHDNEYSNIFLNNIQSKYKVIVCREFGVGFKIEESSARVVNNTRVIELKEFNLPPYLVDNKNELLKNILDLCYQAEINKRIDKIYLIMNREDAIFFNIAKGVFNKLKHKCSDKIEVVLIDKLKLRVILERKNSKDCSNYIVKNNIDIEGVELIEEFMNLYIKSDLSGIIDVLFNMTMYIDKQETISQHFRELYCKIVSNTLELV